MNTSKAKKTGKTENKEERQTIEVRDVAVKQVRVIAGKTGDLVFFTLVLNGVTIYNCRVATGKNGDFISFPQYKGSDGKYYNNVYVALAQEDSEAILQEIQRQIDEG